MGRRSVTGRRLIVSRLLDARYEEGFRDGESSAWAEWAGALSEVLPVNVYRGSPADVVTYVEMLQGRRLPLTNPVEN